MTPEAAKKFLTENNVKFILAQFVDIHGVAKTKSVPANCLMDIVETGAGFAGFAVYGDWIWNRITPTLWPKEICELYRWFPGNLVMLALHVLVT